MATSKTKAEEAELQAAAELVLEQEEQRKARIKRRMRREKRKREQEQLASVQRMQQSIETMKVCIVTITAIMLTGVVISVWALWALNGKVVEVQAELDKLKPEIESVVDQTKVIVGHVGEAVDEVEKVREALRNPMESIGGAIGRNLDGKIQALMNERLGSGE